MNSAPTSLTCGSLIHKIIKDCNFRNEVLIMNKIAKKLFVSTALMICAALTACTNPNNNSGSGAQSSGGANTSGDAANPTVTFRLNYKKGDEDVFKKVTVEKGKKVQAPEDDPERDGFVFNGWHEDYLADSEFEFDETPIVKDTKIFAHWLEIFKCTFDYNYAGAPAAKVVNVVQKKAVARPEDPTRDGYQFIGWTLNKETGADGYDEYYDFTRHFTANTTLYAKWGKVGDPKAYRFEAEYCDVLTKGMGMSGSTYSGVTQGKGLIQVDDENVRANSSNGHFVHFLYNNGNNLEFHIKSNAAGKAKVVMRLSGEYREEFGISATGDAANNISKYTIKINGVAQDYGTIKFTEVPLQGFGWKPFADYLLAAEVDIKEGENVVEMITDNTDLHQGTAVATAPMIDCLTFETAQTLTWMNAKASNIED